MSLATKHDVYYQPLGEVCALKSGKVLSKQYIRNHLGAFPVIGSG